MSSDSENEQFFDAEESTLNNSSKTCRKRDSLSKRASSEPNVACAGKQDCKSENAVNAEKADDHLFLEPRVPPSLSHQAVIRPNSIGTVVPCMSSAFSGPEGTATGACGSGRRKFRELRQRLATEDHADDCQANNINLYAISQQPTPPNSGSRASSIEGVFVTTSATGIILAPTITSVSNQQPATVPFRVIELDALSLQSIGSLGAGRIGRLLGGPTIGTTNGAPPVTNKDMVTSTATIGHEFGTIETKRAPSVSALSVSSHSSSTPSSRGISKVPSLANLILPLQQLHQQQLPMNNQNPSKSVTNKVPPTTNNLTSNEAYDTSQTNDKRISAIPPISIATSVSSPNTPCFPRRQNEPDVILDIIASAYAKTSTSNNEGPNIADTTPVDNKQQKEMQRTDDNKPKNPSNASRDYERMRAENMLQQPNVIPPVAPPRRKKLSRKTTVSSVDSDKLTPISSFEERPSRDNLNNTVPSTMSAQNVISSNTSSRNQHQHQINNNTSSTPSSRASTIRSVHSLDLRQVMTCGQFVIRPQDSCCDMLASDDDDKPFTKCDADSNKNVDSSDRSSVNRSSAGHYSLGPHRSSHHDYPLLSQQNQHPQISAPSSIAAGIASTSSSSAQRLTFSGNLILSRNYCGVNSNIPSSVGGGASTAASRSGSFSGYRRMSRERRKSAGDETKATGLSSSGSAGRSTGGGGVLLAYTEVGTSQQEWFANVRGVRTRTDSGKQLSDLEILQQVTVLNLDTGERIPLSVAEDKLPRCVNPLSLHIMRLTSEYATIDESKIGGSVLENSSNQFKSKKKHRYSKDISQEIKDFFADSTRSKVMELNGQEKRVHRTTDMEAEESDCDGSELNANDSLFRGDGSIETDDDRSDAGSVADSIVTMSSGATATTMSQSEAKLFKSHPHRWSRNASRKNSATESSKSRSNSLKISDRKNSIDESASKLEENKVPDTLSDIASAPIKSAVGGRVKRRTAKLRKFLGTTVKKTMHAARSIAQDARIGGKHSEQVDEDEIASSNSTTAGQGGGTNTVESAPIKHRAASSYKGPYDFEKIQHIQDLKAEHEGPIWCMKFSGCGRLLATAGQDRLLRIWTLREAYPFFQEMRIKYGAEKVSPSASQESLVSHHSTPSVETPDDLNRLSSAPTPPPPPHRCVFMPRPFCVYAGHTSDLLDVSWSRNYFLLSSSMDKTVRLWHIRCKECLCCFQHVDFVTAIAFHPKDDRYFLSGSLDGKIRLWNIPDKKVAVWNEVEGTTRLITAANFCQNGKFAVVGSYDGRCIFYNTDQLKYHTQINVRSARGRNAARGRKISGIEPMPGEDKILVTSNDSRIRLYDLRGLNMSCKYRGHTNTSSQMRASFSHDGKYVISGSENRDIYIWRTSIHDYNTHSTSGKLMAAAVAASTVGAVRNDSWEAIRAHTVSVTCAVFAPHPDAIIKMLDEAEAEMLSLSTSESSFASEGKGRGNIVRVVGEMKTTTGGETLVDGGCLSSPDRPATTSERKMSSASSGRDTKKVVEDPMVEQRVKGGTGYVVVSADFHGCIKVFVNRTKPKHSSLPASALA